MTYPTLRAWLLYLAGMGGVIGYAWHLHTLPPLQLFGAPPCSGEWTTVSQVVSNAYFEWRLNPAAQLECAIVGDTWIPWVTPLIILVASAWVLLSSHGSWTMAAYWAALMGLGILLACGGLDITVLDALSWSPALIASLYKHSSKPSFVTLALVATLSILTALSAYHLTIPILLFALIATFLLGGRTSAAVLSVITAVGLISLLTPIPVNPDYPHLARVVPDDGMAGIIRPLIGPDFSIPIIAHRELASALYPLTIYLVGLSLLLILTLRKNSTRVPYLWGALAVAVCLEASLPEDLTSIAPLQAVTRMIPGFFLFSPLPITLAFLWMCCSFIGMNHRNLRISLVVGSGILALMVLLPPPLQVPCEETHPSPSLYVMRYFGGDLINRQEVVQNAHFTPASAKDVTIRTSHQKREAAFRYMYDGRETTRWTPGRGMQRGDEWVSLKFTAPRGIEGLQLSTGKFISDYPRGLRIHAQESCSDFLLPEKAEATPLVEYASWQGPLRFTQQGFPYFGAQSDVEIFFKGQTVVHCLLIEQIGDAESFDWSVSELKFVN